MPEKKMEEYSPYEQRGLKRRARAIMKEENLKYTAALRRAKAEFEEAKES